MVSIDNDGAGRRGNPPPEFIFMLTRNDMTVPVALAVYRQVRDIPGLRLAGAYLALGVIEQEAKQVEAALTAYEKYLELAPKDRYAGTIRQQVKALRRGR